MEERPNKAKRSKVTPPPQPDAQLVQDLMSRLAAIEEKNAAMEKKNAAMEVQMAEQQKKLADQRQMAAMERMVGGLEIGNSSKTYPLDFRASWDQFSDRSRSHSPASSRSQSPASMLNAEERLFFMEMFLQRSKSPSPTPHPN